MRWVEGTNWCHTHCVSFFVNHYIVIWVWYQNARIYLFIVNPFFGADGDHYYLVTSFRSILLFGSRCIFGDIFQDRIFTKRLFPSYLFLWPPSAFVVVAFFCCLSEVLSCVSNLFFPPTRPGLRASFFSIFWFMWCQLRLVLLEICWSLDWFNCWFYFMRLWYEMSWRYQLVPYTLRLIFCEPLYRYLSLVPKKFIYNFGYIFLPRSPFVAFAVVAFSSILWKW